MNHENNKLEKTEGASVIASRQSCDAEGVGLSHYILMDKGTSSEAQSASVIASRQSCDAEGVGLSHYILMDKGSR